MRIAFFIPDLRAGGVERVRLLLAREFVAKGHEVDLVLLQKVGVLLADVPNGVRVIGLDAPRIRQGFMPLMRYLRSEKPDAVLASMWPLTTLAVLVARIVRFRGRLVVSEHNTLSRSAPNNGIRGMVLGASMRLINGRADSVVGVSAGVVKDLHAMGLNRSSGTVIHNPVAISSASDMPNDWTAHPWLRVQRPLRVVAVGTLKKQKDYPTLLRAVKRLVDSGRPICLLILGGGPLEAELKDQRAALGLQGSVFFGGFVADPTPFYHAAGLFVLSSAWEGFGNVIVEALAAGTPVVSTDCPSGPAEILENGRYGRLVPVGDDAALASVVASCLDEIHDRDALRKRAADFAVEKVAAKYLQLMGK